MERLLDGDEVLAPTSQMRTPRAKSTIATAATSQVRRSIHQLRRSPDTADGNRSAPVRPSAGCPLTLGRLRRGHFPSRAPG